MKAIEPEEVAKITLSNEVRGAKTISAVVYLQPGCWEVAGRTPTEIMKYKAIIKQISTGCWRLGAVAGPSDIKKRGRKVIEELTRDLDPASREAVTRVYENWKGAESEEELRRILGKRRTAKFLRTKS